MEEQIRQIVRSYSRLIMHDKFYFWPEIPRRKLNTVLKSYAKGIQPSEVLALIDNTVFGSAKDGGIITTHEFIAHNPLEGPRRALFGAINSVTLAEGLVSTIHINDGKFLELSIQERQPIMTFVKMLREIVNLHSPQTAVQSETQSPVEALKQLKELLDSGIITPEEFEIKRKQYLERL
ncbi:MAG: SHOCT domain-containing protein [bacterium]